MKSFIYTMTSLSFIEFIILVICFCFFIKQFTFEDYMSELYRKNQDLLSEDDKYGHDYKSKKFNAVFGTYDNSMPFIHVLIKILAILFLFANFVSMLPFIIVYLCHLCRRTCCKCKKACSYVSLIFSIIFSIPYLLYAIAAKSKIDLPDEEIYSYDPDFNEETRKNIKNYENKKNYFNCWCISCLYIVYS